jgi:lysophospholipase L1-like esterase
MRFKRVLILTDSLGLPRGFPQICEYEKTWCVKLKEDFIVHQVSIGGATSGDILRQCPYHLQFRPDIVIVQVGIVDCAPRFVTKFELDLIKKLPTKISKAVLKVLNKKSVRSIRKITYTKRVAFLNNILKIQNYFNGVPVAFIAILPPSSDYETILPGIKNRVKQFNQILKEEINLLIETDDFDDMDVMTDNIHLNVIGHNKIYVKVNKFLATCKDV